jgi:hypothetical protein
MLYDRYFYSGYIQNDVETTLTIYLSSSFGCTGIEKSLGICRGMYTFEPFEISDNGKDPCNYC